MPGRDRIIEIAAVLLRPGGSPTLIFDTLVDPRRPVGPSELHGLREEDLAGAPKFRRLVPELRQLLAGRVVVAHNASFDARMLGRELAEASWGTAFPHLCTMRLPLLLGLGHGDEGLQRACEKAGVALPKTAHRAREDALATAGLLSWLLGEASEHDLPTFGDLERRAGVARRECAFLDSFAADLWAPYRVPIGERARLKARGAPQSSFPGYLQRRLADETPSPSGPDFQLDDAIPRHAMQSSLLRSIGFMPTGQGRGIIEAEFMKGGVVRYYGVPNVVFSAIMGAESAGRAWLRMMNAGYPEHEVEPRFV